MKKITVSGIGYVGYANLVILQEMGFDVTAYDINPEKGTTDRESAYKTADYIFLCVPTDSNGGKLDTSILEGEVKYIKQVNPECVVVIRSTCPVGFTSRMIKKYDMNIIFYPEFLREGTSVEDSRNPDRVIIGTEYVQDLPFLKGDIIFCNPSEAETIKLFSNTYLALRVAFFNEVDNFCIRKDLSASDVITGICKDKRIGNHYNNPSFGFGGYCLPKDSRELENQVKANSVINSISLSNFRRKKLIADYINKNYAGKKIGVYKLAMKSGSDNSRESAIVDVIKMLKCEPVIYSEGYETDINKLFDCDVIICNRYESELDDFTGEIFTRDIFGRD